MQTAISRRVLRHFGIDCSISARKFNQKDYACDVLAGQVLYASMCKSSSKAQDGGSVGQSLLKREYKAPR